MMQKKFIIYNLKIKGNTPYPILLNKASLSPIESAAMFRYLMYKKKLHNMESKRLPKIASNFSKTPTCTSSAGGIRMLSLGSTFGGLKRRSSWEARKLSKILLPPILRTRCGMLRRWRVKGS